MVVITGEGKKHLFQASAGSRPAACGCASIGGRRERSGALEGQSGAGEGGDELHFQGLLLLFLLNGVRDPESSGSGARVGVGVGVLEQRPRCCSVFGCFNAF